MTMRLTTAALLLAWTVGPAAEAVAQDAQQAARITVSLSTDTIGLGDPFELLIDVELPPEQVVFFPDTVFATSVLESFRPVSWTVEDGEAGSQTVRLRYPLIGYRVGGMLTPPVALFTGSPDPRVARVDGPIGPWDEMEATPELAGILTAHSISGQEVWIGSVLTIEGLADGYVPRPADDVLGASWHWPSLLLIGLFGSALLLVAGLAGRDFWAIYVARRRDPVDPIDRLEAARLAALAALDSLLGRGLHKEGRVEEFYEESSAAVRGYVEHFEHEWGPAHTSSELMDELETHHGAEARAELLDEMGTAEVVKFGRLRPEPATAEEHWSTLRDWVDETKPNAPGSTTEATADTEASR